MFGIDIGLGLAGLVYLLIVVVFVFEVFMFLDAFKNPRLTSTERLVWCAAMLLLHPFVAIIYYFAEYPKRKGAQS